MPLPTNIRRSVSRQAAHLLESGQRFTRFDQIRQRHFWSTYFFNPDGNGYINPNDYPVFVTPSGSNGQGFPAGAVLTDRETNWKSQNRVPDNQNLEVTEIGVTVGVVVPSMDPSNNVDINPDPALSAAYDQIQGAFLNNSIVNITYLTNSVPLGLSADFAQASGPSLGTYMANPEGGNVLFRSNGFASPALRRKFKIPILLQHGETFAFSYGINRAFWIGIDRPFVARLDFWATESFVEKS